MAVNVQGVIRGIVSAGELAHTQEAAAKRRPVITISRGMGSGGNEIAEILAKRLGVECWGKQILDEVAKSAHVEPELIQKLHEMISSASDSWLYALVFGKNVTKDDYLYRLVATVRGLYWKGGVIVGRGANVILEGRDVLRVRILGSVDACAKRVAAQEGVSVKKAAKMVTESNERREKFCRKMFDCDLNDPAAFDLAINTDHFASYEQVCDIIVNALGSLQASMRPTGTTRK